MSASGRKTEIACAASTAPPSKRAAATTVHLGFVQNIIRTISVRSSSIPTVTASKRRVTRRSRSETMADRAACIRRAEGIDADQVLKMARAFHIEDGHPLARAAE